MVLNYHNNSFFENFDLVFIIHVNAAILIICDFILFNLKVSNGYPGARVYLATYKQHKQQWKFEGK